MCSDPFIPQTFRQISTKRIARDYFASAPVHHACIVKTKMYCGLSQVWLAEEPATQRKRKGMERKVEQFKASLEILAHARTLK